MARTLHLDARSGVTAASLLSALVDLGVAPSPILHAVPSLGLPADLHLTMCAEGPVVHLADAPVAHDAPALRQAFAESDLPAGAARLGAEAATLLRLHVAGALSGGAVACLGAAAMAVAELAPARVAVSRIGVPDEPDEAAIDLLAPFAHALDFGAGETTADGAAMLRALVGVEAVGLDEPRWAGVVARGRACGAPALVARLGEASQ